MINALNTTRRNLVLATAGAGMAILFSACGVSSDEPIADPISVFDPPPFETDAETETDANIDAGAEVDVEPTAPDTELDGGDDEIAPLSPVPVDEEPAAPTQLIPASSPDLPCDSYVDVTELPAQPCSKGDVVADFQSWANYIDPDIAVDGYFGPDTFEAVVEMQFVYGLEQTGVIDAALMWAIEADHNEGWDQPVDFPIDEWEPGDEWSDEEGC